MFNAKVLSSLLGLAALGGLVTLASDARAEHKIYHAASCVQRGDTTPQIRYGFTGAVNDATGSRYWVCPAVRDRQGGDVADWDVNVDRNGANTAWDVGLYSCDRVGDNCHWDIVTVPASPADGTQYLDGDSLTSYEAQGPLYLYSSVPAGAQIHSFHVDESNGTD